MAEHQYAIKMRQSLNQFERAFQFENEQIERQRHATDQAVAARSRARFHRRAEKARSLRFYALTLSLILTTVVVTIGMLALLYALLV